MRISPVYNISLLQLIAKHDGIVISDILKNDTFKNKSIEQVKSDLEILMGMGEIIEEDGKYFAP